MPNLNPGASVRAPLRQVWLGRPRPMIERHPDGTFYLRDAESLGRYYDRFTDPLEHWGRVAPERVFLAQRDNSDAWRKLSYADVLEQVRHIAAALLRRKLSRERPIAVLSGNGIEHALIGLAAMYVGIPYASISPAYSLMSTDFGRLRYILNLLSPGLVFVSDGTPFAAAIAATVASDCELVTARNPLSDRTCTSFADLLAETPDASVENAHANVKPETMAKLLFTSGSTGYPKGVINTHRMLCSNQAMIAAGFAFLTEEPPVVVDWLPWSHTFGGNHNFGLVLTNGGSLYIDDGNPTPVGVPKTVRNLREIEPTIYFNVPKGYEALATHLHVDAQLRKKFFRRLKVLFYAGAGLNQAVWDDLQELSVSTTGERVIFLSSLGSTETAPLALACTWDFPRSGNIGLPARGVELKLVPNEGKLEARLRGPNITPGYWCNEALTRGAFDAENYYKLGDALKFADPNDPSQGLLFDGRINEDFKLSTGTWVSVGPLRALLIDHFAPLMRDVVIAGLDRDYVAALVFPEVEACRKLCPDLPADTAPGRVLTDARVRDQFAMRLSALAAMSPGGSTRVCRIMLLEQPPSIDSGEMTDKGSINQRAVLQNRAALVELLYALIPSAHVVAV